jgi:hypothetical protein
MNTLSNFSDFLQVLSVSIATLAGKDGAVWFWQWLRIKITADLEARVKALEDKGTAK